MAEVTLESYLKSDPAVKAARKKFLQSSAALERLSNVVVPPGAGATTGQVNARRDALREEVEAARNQLAQVERTATEYYGRNLTKIREQAAVKESKTLKTKLDDAIRYRQQLADQNLPTTVLDSEIAGLNEQINKTGKYAPKKVRTAEERRPSLAPEPFNYQTFATELNQKISTAGQFIADLQPEERLQLSQALKDAGYKVEVSATYNPTIISAYSDALTQSLIRSRDFNRAVDVTEVLAQLKVEKSGQGDGQPDLISFNISDPTQASALINSTFNSLLGRDATAKEVASLTKKLNAQQNKNPSKTIYEKDASGNTVQRTIGGFNAGEFLSQIVKTLPEFEQRKVSARGLTEQDLEASARANGLDLKKDFGAKTVNDWITRVENGEKIDIFNNLIRQTAKIGLPDNVKKMVDDGLDLETIYAPYKRVMAGTLEVDANSISLDDPTLRQAITPEGEVPIYNFQRLVRKDPRWEYTNNARDEIAQISQRILKDFGFQG